MQQISARRAKTHNPHKAGARASDKSRKPASREAGLGKPGKSVEQTEKRKARRALHFAMKAKASDLLSEVLPAQSKALAGCGRWAIGPGVVTFTRKQTPSGPKASATGLQTCSAIWLCPDCSARIAAQRAAEVNGALQWARAQGYAIHMLTLTMRHDRRDKLRPSLEALKAAMKSLRQSKRWRDMNLRGSIAATEITHSEAAGFHPHAHIILISDAPESEACEAIEALRAEWLRSLKKAGREGNGHAFHVQNASEAGAYVAKMGAAAEITMAGQKAGRNGSQTPMELLAAAAEGCKRSASIWLEYAQAVHGVAALVWSRGLRETVESWLAEKPQAEAEGEGEAEGEEEILLQVHTGSLEWQYAKRRMVAILTAIESGGDIQAALYGPSDAEIWRGVVSRTQVIDDDDKGGP